MFTGIVQDVGQLESLEPHQGDSRIAIAVDRLDLRRVAVGDSICVQGCCVTVTRVEDSTFRADLSRETLGLTTLGELRPGSPVNLESALRAGDALGGHLVSGHVDGVGRVSARAQDAHSVRLTLEAPEA
ncbi:MAG: riboflavin synthase, partial [Steroidobacteraceae bacterium]